MFQQLRERSILRKIRPFRNLDGWLTDQEAIGLYSTARRLPRHATVVEIGSWQGKSTYCLAKGLASGSVYAIDPFNADTAPEDSSRALYIEKKGDKDLLVSFRNNMEALDVIEKIIIKHGYSYQFHEDFNRINLLFIDGDHTIKGCSADFDLYASKIVPGGFIAFHDYYEDRDELGPTYVIKNRVLTSNHFRFHRRYDSLWIARKADQ